MSYRGRFWKKLRKWVGRRLDLTMRVTYPKSDLSRQVGKLLKNRGNELITMSSL